MVASLERLHWRRLGGSVFRYDGVSQADGTLHEDWLNHIAPSLMFPQSFLVARGITLKFLTVDASSIRFLDHSMPVNQRALAHIIDTFPCGKPQAGHSHWVLCLCQLFSFLPSSWNADSPVWSHYGI